MKTRRFGAAEDWWYQSKKFLISWRDQSSAWVYWQCFSSSKIYGNQLDSRYFEISFSLWIWISPRDWNLFIFHEFKERNLRWDSTKTIFKLLFVCFRLTENHYAALLVRLFPEFKYLRRHYATSWASSENESSALDYFSSFHAISGLKLFI